VGKGQRVRHGGSDRVGSEGHHGSNEEGRRLRTGDCCTGEGCTGVGDHCTRDGHAGAGMGGALVGARAD
jgi:hypothetical protein